MKRALTLAIVVCFLTACEEAQKTTTASVARSPMVTEPELQVDPGEGRHFHLTTAEVKRLTVPEILTLNGQIEPDETLTTPVISPMPGRIEKANFQLGEMVKKGEMLAEIRSDEVATVETDLLKDVLSMDADIAENDVDYKLAKSVYERKNGLLGEGIAARADVETAKRDLDHAEAAKQSLLTKRMAIITSASERLRLFGVLPSEINRLLKSRHIDNTFEIYSPRTGVISNRDADLGQLIDNTHGLFVVSDLSKVWLMADVYEKDIERIRVGDRAKVFVDSFPDKAFSGVVDYLASNVTPETRTLKVRVRVDNPQLFLRPKMFARVALQTGERTIVAVPSESVQKTGETYVTYVRTGDNRYRERKVDIGHTYGDFVEVVSGLRQGETVVAHGSLELQGEMIQRISE
jgi:cobalt-zinc-cadmium efflux system membrane fusion protein